MEHSNILSIGVVNYCIETPDMVERLIAAANQLFAKFWLIVLVVLPFLLIYGFIYRQFLE